MCREDKLVVDGKMYVYSEEQGRVVQHRREPGPRAGSRWTSLESIETGSVTIYRYLESNVIPVQLDFRTLVFEDNDI